MSPVNRIAGKTEDVVEQLAGSGDTGREGDPPESAPRRRLIAKLMKRNNAPLQERVSLTKAAWLDRLHSL